MVFLQNGYFSDILTVFAISILLCSVSFILYRFLYGLFCYKGIQVSNIQESNNELNPNDSVITISNIIPFTQMNNSIRIMDEFSTKLPVADLNRLHEMASCVIDDDSNINIDNDNDNDKKLPIATIV